jgi:hypothetical protein
MGHPVAHVAPCDFGGVPVSGTVNDVDAIDEPSKKLRKSAPGCKLKVFRPAAMDKGYDPVCTPIT